MKKLSMLLAVLSLLTSCRTPIRESNYTRPIRVACIGDSITYGHGIPDREHNSYPAQLQDLLGSHWEVRNFGCNGATALRKGTKSYALLPMYQEALSFDPDIVVIQLGTNDTNAKSWAAHKREFITDYLEIVRSFQQLATKPSIYLCRPVPLFRDRGKDYDTDRILVEEVIPQINAIARQKHLPVVDLYAEFKTCADLFPDGVHPNASGAHLMAAAVYGKLTGGHAVNHLNK